MKDQRNHTSRPDKLEPVFSRTTFIGTIAWNKQISVYERAKPMARLLLEWCNDHGRQVIHAGLVAYQGQGILFAGKSGSGKSTSSLACLCGEFNYLGEDYASLPRLLDGSFLGHSLDNSREINFATDPRICIIH